MSEEREYSPKRFAISSVACPSCHAKLERDATGIGRLWLSNVEPHDRPLVEELLKFRSTFWPFDLSPRWPLAVVLFQLIHKINVLARLEL